MTSAPDAAGQLLRAVLDALARVVEKLVRTVLLADRELLVAARGGDHACAHELAELDGRQADAARGSEHQ
jgi:hypothetical protein